jgi:NADPH-dependent 2,4-dienoyl-CoA reductase/sulfur reductase-like enzyme
VLAGGGPLLLLVAMQLLRAGATVTALLEQTRRRDYLRAARWLLPALRSHKDLRDGLSWRRQLRNSGVAFHCGVQKLHILGERQAQQVRFTSSGRTTQLDVNAVLLHDGVTPHTQLSRQAGCAHEWLELQRHWRPLRDAWGATSVAGVSVAGDCGGILGARVAQTQGAIAALDIAVHAQALSATERDERAQPLRDEASRHSAIRPLLDRLYAPHHQRAAHADDDTIMCRCEEVSAGEVRRAARLGATGLNQLKAYTRCGMGACQGRMCSLSIAEIIATEHGRNPSQVDPLRIRPPIVPISIGEIASRAD